MRVCLVGSGRIPIPPRGYGAVERHIGSLAWALERRGHEVHVLGQAFSNDLWGEVRLALEARRALGGISPDIVHIHTPLVALLLSQVGGWPYVYTSHSRHWTLAEGLREKGGLALEIWAVRRAQAVITLSESMRREVQRRAGVESTVIPNGVDVRLFVPGKERSSPPVVVGLGEIARHKEWHVAALATAGLGCTLKIAGPIRDPLYANEIEHVGNHVRIEGPLAEEEVLLHLQKGDLLIHPSRSEGLPLAVLEGMAVGLPVLGTDLLSEVVEEARSGFLVPSKAPEEERVLLFRKNLERLLGDPKEREKMGREARRVAVERYSWDRVALEVQGVYEKVLENKRT